MNEKTTRQTHRWEGRPRLAAFLRVLTFVVPFAVSIVFIIAASRIWTRPSGFWPTVGWWVALSGAATVVLRVLQHVAKKAMPLIALLKLSLVFPDHAPSRFRAAMKTNTVRQLERQVATGEAPDHVRSHQEHAEHLLHLVAELSEHDRMTRGHTERVRAYTLMIGEEMGLPPEDLDLLHWAGLIHDIGKLHVPTEILNKDGAPTDEEWKILRDHPAAGGPMVEPLRDWLGEWIGATTEHHERWDGTGYPLGLKGEEISRAGRIVAVADAYDVITSVRSYKPALSPAVAREELANGAGTQFDPTVVRAFLNISIGRLRAIAGPLSWLTHIPILGQTLIAPAATTAATTAATAGAAAFAAVATGLAAEAPPEPVPDPPAELAFVEEITALDAARELDEDTSVTISIRDLLDVDPESIVVLTRADGATVEVDPGGELTFTPAPDFSGEVSLDYEACLPDSCDTATIRFVVNPVNDAPVAADDAATVAEDGQITIDVLANDSDRDDDALAVTGITQPTITTLGPSSAGPLGAVGDAGLDGGQITYAPPPDFNGSVVIDYVIADGNGGEDAGRLRLTVSPANDPPVAVDDRVTMPGSGPATFGVLDNDVDIDGDTLRIQSVTAPDGASAGHDGTLVSFTPPAGFVGTTSFSYRVADPGGATDSAVVTVEVLNAAPDVVTDSATVLEDAAPTPIDVLANDVDANLDPATLTVVTAPTSGTASVSSGQVLYSPDPDANGTDSFGYRVCDTVGSCGQTKVSVTITAVNDAPTFAPGVPPVVDEDSGPQSFPGWATLTAGPADESAQTLSFASAAPLAQQQLSVATSTTNPTLFASLPKLSADGTLRFTAAPNANGTASVTVTIVDSGGTANGGIDTMTASFAITVDAVNDPPVFVPGPAPVVNEDSGPVNLPGWATVSPGPADEATGPLSIATGTTNPALFATLPAIAADGTLSFVPAADASGSATVTVTLVDSGGATTTAGFVVTIVAVNDPPTIALGPAPSVTEDSGTTTLPGWATFTAGPADETGQALTITTTNTDPALFAAQPVITVGGTLSFEPAPNANGSATITVKAVDDGGTANGGLTTTLTTFTLTVTPENDPPSIADQTFSVDEDSPAGTVVGTVIAGDVDTGDSLFFAITGPNPGFLLDTGTGKITVDTVVLDFETPPTSYTLTVEVSDDGTPGLTTSALVTIDVADVLYAPTAADDGFTTPVSTPLVVAAPGVLSNDSDEDNDLLTVSTTPVTPPASGSVVLGTDGSFTYTPLPGFRGLDSFEYKVDDGTGRTDTATARIVVDDGVSGLDLYLTSAPSGTDRLFGSTPEPATTPVPDYDGDTDPGLTIEDSDGDPAESDPGKFETWAYSPASAVQFNGPVIFELWSTTAGFLPSDDVDLNLVLFDCAAGGGSCVQLLEVDQHIGDWNGGVADWVFRSFDLGLINHTILPTRQLEMKLMFGHEPIWVAMSGENPGEHSRLRLSLANASPIANDDTPSVDEEASAEPIDVLDNDVDANLDPATVTVTGGPGALRTGIPDPVTGEIPYTAAGTFDNLAVGDSFTDTFTYEVCDTGGLCSTATVTITVTGVNDPPLAVDDGPGAGFDTDADKPFKTDDLSDNDLDADDGETLTVVAFDPVSAAGALLTDAGGNKLDYDPNGLFDSLPEDATTTDTFAYTIEDSQGAQSSATVTIDIVGVNDPPTVADQAFSVAENAASTVVIGTVVASDIDTGDNLEYSFHGGNPGFAIDSVSGELTVGSVALDFETPPGSYTVTVRVTDDSPSADHTDATITITVLDAPDPPAANDDGPGIGFATDEETAFTTADVRVNDTDPEGGPLTVISMDDSGTVGTVTDNGDGTFGYDPAGAFEALAAGATTTDSFSYTIEDAESLTSSATVTIEITGRNDGPALAAIGDRTVTELVAFTIALSGSDIDDPGTDLVFGVVSPPSWLTLDDNGDGTAELVGTPPVGASATGPFTITVDIEDGEPLSAGETFDITVDPAYVTSPLAGQLVINEVLFRTLDDDEFVELFNAGSASVDLTDFVLTDRNLIENDFGFPSFAFTFPAIDVWGSPATLDPGEYAVVWVQDHGLPWTSAPDASLEFEIGEGYNQLRATGDDLWLHEPSMELIDYMSWNDGSGVSAPPPGYLGATWDDTYNVDNGGVALDQSLSLTPNGVDSDTSACWEPTTDGTAGSRPECAGAPTTWSYDPFGARRITLGVNNNAPASPAVIVISELRTVGPAGSSDEFIELYNPTAAPVSIEGFTIKVDNGDLAHATDIVIDSNNDGAATTAVIGPNSFYLLAGASYSGSTVPDQTFAWDIAKGAGLALFDGPSEVDAVGTNAGGNSGSGSLYFEGDPLAPMSGSNDQSYERRNADGHGACVDTDDNAADFTHNFNASTPQNSGATQPCGTPPPFVAPPDATSVVISELRLDGPNGGRDEFVELFNPTSATVDMTGWVLRRQDGLDYHVFGTFGPVDIGPGEHLLLAGLNFATPSGVTADISYVGSITNGSGVYLEDASSAVVDAVSLSPGGLQLEGLPLPPISGRVIQSYERLLGFPDGNCVDTDDNTADFFHNMGTENPQNLASPATPCNEPPVAVTDYFATPPDVFTSFTPAQLAGSDYDVEDGGPPLAGAEPTVTYVPGSLTAGAGTMWQPGGPGTDILYNPTFGWTGNARWEYEICDSGDVCSIGTVWTIVGLPGVADLYLGSVAADPQNNDLLLPMSTTSPSGPPADLHDGSDPNPGMLIQKGDSIDPLDETDPTKYAIWSYTAPAGGLGILGPADAHIWTAIKDLDNFDKGGDLWVQLLTCPAGAARHSTASSGCRPIATAQEARNPWGPTNGVFINDTFDFGSLGPHVVEPGDELRLKVVVDGDSADDMWIAFDGASVQSVLHLS